MRMITTLIKKEKAASSFPSDYGSGRTCARSSKLHVGDPQSGDQNEGIDERAGKSKAQEFKHIGAGAEDGCQALGGRGGKESENRQNEGGRGDRGGRLPQKEINLHGAAPDREKAQEQEVGPCSGRRRGGKPWRAKSLEQHDVQTDSARDRGERDQHRRSRIAARLEACNGRAQKNNRDKPESIG